jgi:hypothetical protein
MYSTTKRDHSIQRYSVGDNGARWRTSISTISLTSSKDVSTTNAIPLDAPTISSWTGPSLKKVVKKKEESSRAISYCCLCNTVAKVSRLMAFVRL